MTFATVSLSHCPLVRLLEFTRRMRQNRRK